MADHLGIDPALRGKVRGGDVDRAIAELAERQQAVVGRRQLLALGVRRRAIEHRLECGRLHIVYRGVYAVGHRILTPDGWRMAAVLLAGEGAVASHRSAGAHHLIRPSSRKLDEVTVHGPHRHCKAVQFHYGRLPPDEIMIVRGVPVTTVSRTIFDCAAVLRPTQVERMVGQADILRLTDSLSLQDVLERYPRRRGAPTIREILGARSIGLGVTREELEARFQEFLRKYGLPRPELNAWLKVGKRWYQVDCLWRIQQLIVELDGRETHHTIAAFESDRVRDRALSVAEWRVIRVTWRQLHEDPDELAADLWSLLRRPVHRASGASD